MKKIWQKNQQVKNDPLLDAYLISKGTPDNVLIPYDVTASIAHVKMLEKIGILSPAESLSLQKALAEVDFVLTLQDEDCHSALEKYLIAKCGEAGRKIHTGRSRNDQVLVAMRLLMKDKLDEVRRNTAILAGDFLAMAGQYEHVPFPGYTHSQQAMLSSLGHYFASFVESLLDDRYMQDAAYKLIDQNPLGSAAGFGVSLALDREMTAKELGFAKIQQNSLYCQTSRGKFESFVLESLVQTMMTLARFAHDMIIFTTREFDYFEVDDVMTTGSSMMPQKKNLDYMEVLRGELTVITSLHLQVQSLVKNQLSGYNKDLKFVKNAVIDAFEIVLDSLLVAKKMLGNIKPKRELIEAKLSKGIFAADVANEMVMKEGIAFRDAYGFALNNLENYEVDLEKNLASKVSFGAPGNLGLEQYRKRLNSLT